MTRDPLGRYQHVDELHRLLEMLAVVPVTDREWSHVRAAILSKWPTREDVGEWQEQARPGQVAPEERDVDVPEV